MNTYILGIACIAMCMSGTAHAQRGGLSGRGDTAFGRGIMQKLFKDGAGIAGEQAIKTATEEAVKRGVPLPTEQYNLLSGLCYYNERTWGIYVWNRWPSRNFTCWVDLWSNVSYKLSVNGGVVSKDPDWFEEQVRSYRCAPSPGNEWNLVTTMKYRPQCVVVTQNIAHAVNVHPAVVIWTGPRLPSNCGDAPTDFAVGGSAVTIGRGSYTEVDVPGWNWKIDYSYITY